MTNEAEMEKVLKTLRRAMDWVVIGSDWHFEEAYLDGEEEATPWHVMQDELESAIISATALESSKKELEEKLRVAKEALEFYRDADEDDGGKEAKTALASL